MKVKVEKKIETVKKNVKPESEIKDVKNVKEFDLDKYFETRWQKRVNFDKDYLDTQEILGYCALCTHFHSAKCSIMKYHFYRVHHKHSIVVNNIRHLFYKCQFVPSRGADNPNRNSHFHCMKYHKVCDKKSYKIHLMSKHNIV